MTRLLPGLTLVWYLALVAMVGDVRDPEPAESSPDPWPATEAPTQLAINILKRSTMLTSAAVGFAGNTPTEVLAWRFLVQTPIAESYFLEVFSQSPNRAGQLWALAGLRVVAPRAFERRARLLERDEGEVETLVGCVKSTRPIRVVVIELRRFDWIREFLRDPRSPT